jgi:hypothetical protein
VLKVPEHTGLTLSLTDGNAVLPFPIDCAASVRIEALRQGGEPTLWTMSGSTARVYVSQPGRYLIHFREPVAGYLKPDDQIVDLALGTMTDVVIRLTRKP